MGLGPSNKLTDVFFFFLALFFSLCAEVAELLHMLLILRSDIAHTL